MRKSPWFLSGGDLSLWSRQVQQCWSCPWGLLTNPCSQKRWFQSNWFDFILHGPQVPTTAAPSGGKMCYDCGYLIDGWTQDGPNYQHPMTDGTPQAMPILRIDTNSYKGCPLKKLLIKFKKLPMLIWTHSRTMREKMVEDYFALQHQLANMNSGGDFLGHPLHSVWRRGNIGRPCDFVRWRGRVLWSGSRVLHPVNDIYFTSNNSTYTPNLILSRAIHIMLLGRLLISQKSSYKSRWVW